MRHSRRIAFLLAVLAAAALGAVTAAWLLGRPAHGSMTVTVAGRSVSVPAGTTLGKAAAAFGVRPQDGDLLDVAGKVLRVGIDPGTLLVDGHPSPAQTRLRGGDRITVVDGRDRREPLSRRVTPAPGGRPSDPQFSVSRTPGEEVVVRGAISHELVSATFHATGVAKAERAVALTFDDGPSPDSTPRILTTLHRLRAPATFFVIGYLAAAHPELVRRELHLGMEVGNHSYNHPEVPPFDELPPRLANDEIALGEQILARLGAKPRLFRPPGGSFSPAVVRAASALGERVVLWSVDPTDWAPGASAKQIAHRVLTAVRPGSIVILHDGGGDRSATLAALPAIVRGIRKRGLRLVTVDPGATPVAAAAGPSSG